MKALNMIRFKAPGEGLATSELNEVAIIMLEYKLIAEQSAENL